MRRGLQVVMTILGTVALVAGGAGVLGGADGVPGVDTVPANLDSELRFFATWYMATGAAVLLAVRRVESAGPLVRLVFAALFIAGCSRIISWVVVGRPDTWFVILMVIELVLPFILIPWQALVARASIQSSS